MKTPVIISKLEPLKPTCKLDEILLATNRGMIETKVKNNDPGNESSLSIFLI